jgi:hypothetical protein
MRARPSCIVVAWLDWLVGWLWKTKNAKKCSATFFPSEFVYSQKNFGSTNFSALLSAIFFQRC